MEKMDLDKMNFVKLNNNIEPNNMNMNSGYYDKLKIDTPVPMTVYGNCQTAKVRYNYDMKDECCFVEKFDLDMNVKDEREAKMSGKVRVVVEKLPESVVQQYLAKKEKNYEKMNFGRKLSNSSAEEFVRKDKISNYTEGFRLNRCLIKKSMKNLETDKFVNELCKPNMQQYLANTEMGCLTDDFEEISDPLEYPTKADNCTIDSLIENLSGNADEKYPVEKEKRYQDQFIKSLSYTTVQQCNVDPSIEEAYVDIEEIDDFIKSPTNVKAQDNVSKKKNSNKKKRIKRRKCRPNITTKLCQRICQDCHRCVRGSHKVSDKVKCDTCKALTLFECNACKKKSNTYSGITDHLLYRCEARHSYECAHCKYSVKKKQTLSFHIKRHHETLILKRLLRKSNKSTQKDSNKPNQDSEQDKRFENLIVLKKQKEMTYKSEWVVENVKRSDLKVNKSMDFSALPKNIADQPMQKSTSPIGVENMAQPYQLCCEYCDKEIAIDVFKTQTYCRTCGTDFRFKCLKCRSTCDSYQNMKLHLKKCCTLKPNSRQSFHCSECNYRSFFQGLVLHHQYKVHGIDESQQFFSDNLIQNYSQNY